MPLTGVSENRVILIYNGILPEEKPFGGRGDQAKGTSGHNTVQITIIQKVWFFGKTQYLYFQVLCRQRQDTDGQNKIP
jgi:hypothetical protein